MEDERPYADRIAQIKKQVANSLHGPLGTRRLSWAISLMLDDLLWLHDEQGEPWKSIIAMIKETLSDVGHKDIQSDGLARAIRRQRRKREQRHTNTTSVAAILDVNASQTQLLAQPPHPQIQPSYNNQRIADQRAIFTTTDPAQSARERHQTRQKLKEINHE